MSTSYYKNKRVYWSTDYVKIGSVAIYKELGGNGTAKKMIDDVSKLPIVSSRN